MARQGPSPGGITADDRTSRNPCQAGTNAMSVDIEVGLPQRPPSDAEAFKTQRRKARHLRLFEPSLVRMATWQSIVMLDPRNMMRNPVMFLVEVGTVLTAMVTVQSIIAGAATGLIVYQAALTALLLLTVLFANFAEALA